jgi:hypothetical protein
MDRPPASRGFMSRRQEQTPVYNAFAMPLAAGVAAAWGIVLTPRLRGRDLVVLYNDAFIPFAGETGRSSLKRIRDAVPLGGIGQR